MVDAKRLSYNLDEFGHFFGLGVDFRWVFVFGRFDFAFGCLGLRFGYFGVWILGFVVCCFCGLMDCGG